MAHGVGAQRASTSALPGLAGGPTSRVLICSSIAAAASVPLRSLLDAWLKERGGAVGLYLPTALALKPDFQQRAAVVKTGLEALLGLRMETLDLDEYAKWSKFERGRPQPDDAAMSELNERVAGASMLVVSGGNTFYLQAAVLSSGFDRVAKQHVGQGGLPYVGQSAGAIVTGQTVATAFWKGWDDPGVVPHFDFAGNAELSRGMNLLGGRAVFPHYDPDTHAGLVALRRGELAKPGMLLTLTEEEAFVWTRDGEQHQSAKLTADGTLGRS